MTGSGPVKGVRSHLLALGYFIWLNGSAWAETGEIAGTVIDAETGRPLDRASVSLLERGDEVGTAGTDTLGAFRFTDLAARPHTLVIARITYAPRRIEGLDPHDSASAELSILLSPSPVTTEDVVITASRQRERRIRAPASTSTVERGSFENAVPFTAVDLTRTVTGMDFASKGLTQHTFAVRGDRSVNSTSLLVLTDYRYSAVPSIGFNIPYLISPTSADIERIEVIRGPGAALYGPDSDQGVLHIITRSPLQSQGAQLTMTAGERSIRQSSLRVSTRLGDGIAAKVSADYFRGDDWVYQDRAEQANRQAELDAGADADTLRTGRRDLQIERLAGHARIDWIPGHRTAVTVSGGISEAMNNVDLTQTGAVQVRGWQYSHVQAQVSHGQFFANLMYNWGNAGDSYFLRTGLPVVDQSRQLAVQLQQRAELDPRRRIVYGVDARLTEPRTGGSIHGRNEQNDRMGEIGTYVHGTVAVLPALDVVTALRADYHDRLEDLVFSPRVGAVFEPARDHAFRLVYNRAFNSPDAIDLFIDLSAGSLGPYDVRLSGVPSEGFSFSRNCGGLCMQVPGVPQSVPADATLTWDLVVDLLSDAGIDLSDIPPPTASDVDTELKALDLAGERFLPIDEGDVRDVPPLKRTITNAIEFGYQGVIRRRATIGFDAYYRRITDGTGSFVAATPSVFYDRETLRQYLNQHLDDETLASFVADTVSAIPVGTVAPREVESTDILLVTRQGGTYANWGADVSVDVELSQSLRVGANYSWLRRNVIEDVNMLGTVVLGVPKHKAAASIGIGRESIGLTGTLRGRWIDAFPVASGVYVGTVPAYTVLDVNIAYRPPRWPRVHLLLDVGNVLDHRHQEMVGAPEIGRLMVGRLQVSI